MVEEVISRGRKTEEDKKVHTLFFEAFFWGLWDMQHVIIAFGDDRFSQLSLAMLRFVQQFF